MADDNRFFRWLGRINSLLFFLGAAGLIAAVGIPALVWATMPRETPVSAETKSGEDTYSFGGALSESVNSSLLTHLDGTDEGIIVLQRDTRRGSYGLSSDSRSYEESMVNLLSVDLKTMKNRWVFHGVKRDITDVYRVRETVPVPQDATDPVTALLMDVAEADTNGDGKITSADHHSLYVYRLGGTEPTKLIDAWSVSNVQQFDGERIAVTYYDGKIDHALLLSARDFHTIADAPLSTTPK
ncbi:MAG TPA: hypothetical protein VFV07_13390 [Rhizomicrobium sp.]|nr:hypothetical protein [Rhizomicrobium sp.]